MLTETKIPIVCTDCGATGTADLPFNLASIETTNINITNPCPKCGGRFYVGGGKWERNEETGTLERKGDGKFPLPPKH